LDNVESGSAFFNGKLSASFKTQIPQFEFNFGLKDIDLYLPVVKSNISDLNIDGYLNSGIKNNYTDARLEIKKLTGKLPGGHINLVFSAYNFVDPDISYSCDMEADITGFDEVFNLGGIDSLKGCVRILDEFQGTYFTEADSIDESFGNSIVVLDSLSFILADSMIVRILDGRLQGNNDLIEIIDLNFVTNHSDILINGKVFNLYEIAFHEHSEITVDIHIVSDTFDFPKMFAFEPIVSRSWPYRLIDMDMDMGVSTTPDKLLEFNFNPEILFTVHSMDVTVEDLFPPAKLHNGTILLTEKQERIRMIFEDFRIDVAGSELKPYVDYWSPPVEPDIVEVDVLISDLNPAKFFYFDRDTISELINGMLNGFVKSEIEIGLDELDFESFKLETDKLEYISKEDTIDIRNLSLKAIDITYLNNEDADFISTLSANCFLRAGRIRTDYFDVNDVAYDVKAIEGTFNVIPESFQFFGKEGSGQYILSPFTENPRYEIKYKVEQFQVDDLFSNFLSDTIITGKMDFDIDIVVEQIGGNDLLSNFNGNIYIYGHDLTLYGMDIDILIKKFSRSQKFNLIDIGAVVVAGPYGLLVTKGSDYANLALGNPGETTRINNLISEWSIEHGKMILEDVAFSTEINRIAGIGWINLATDSLEVNIAVLDKNGCDILSQSLFGSLDDPEQSELKVVGTVLGPITNLIDGVLGKECDQFYDGKILHPAKKSKK